VTIRTFLWVVAGACVVLGAGRVGLQSQSVAPAAEAAVARFHHVHYVVDDPAAAMNEVAKATEGVRVVAQGLGVGVRIGREYLLFDRATIDSTPPVPRTVAAAYVRAADRLKAWGFYTAPVTLSGVRAAAVLPDLPPSHLAFAVDDLKAALTRLEAAGARVSSRREDAVIFDGGDGVFIEILRDTDREETFWCPMHPDVRSADAGRCPLCAMDLVPIPPPKIGEYKLDVETGRDRRSGVIRSLRFAVREPDTNALVTKLQVVHERTFHLFIISRDLRFFDHVHPVRVDDGTYVLQQALPAGEYMLFADFLPVGGTSQMVQRAVISGRPAVRVEPVANAGALAKTATVEGLAVTLEAGPMRAGKEALLTFNVAEAKTGAPVIDLQPYLGAPAHMLIVRADLGDAIHAHPEEVVTGGPTVSFHPLVPSPGDYKLWIQFQRAGRVITVPFELRAEK
jgi:catechol 2,3-dioxygenase-like lactoylglutathione lyase family enzyme